MANLLSTALKLAVHRHFQIHPCSSPPRSHHILNPSNLAIKSSTRVLLESLGGSPAGASLEGSHASPNHSTQSPSRPKSSSKKKLSNPAGAHSREPERFLGDGVPARVEVGDSERDGTRRHAGEGAPLGEGDREASEDGDVDVQLTLASGVVCTAHELEARLLAELAALDSVMVVGEGQEYLACLLALRVKKSNSSKVKCLDSRALESARSVGSTATTVKEAYFCDKFRGYLLDGITRCNMQASSKALRQSLGNVNAAECLNDDSQGNLSRRLTELFNRLWLLRVSFLPGLPSRRLFVCLSGS